MIGKRDPIPVTYNWLVSEPNYNSTAMAEDESLRLKLSQWTTNIAAYGTLVTALRTKEADLKSLWNTYQADTVELERERQNPVINVTRNIDLSDDLTTINTKDGEVTTAHTAASTARTALVTLIGEINTLITSLNGYRWWRCD